MTTSASDLVKSYLAKNYRIVVWPAIGDAKGPKEPGWPSKAYTFADYRDGMRVGLLTGVEVAPDKYLIDVDIDWAPGSSIAQALLPSTSFVFGRTSKRVSHCFYTTPEPLASYRYEDIDKTCLIELRGTKNNGDIGLQTMAPPSVWSKGTTREPLAFVKSDDPAHVDSVSVFKQRVCLSAIAMLFAKHFGVNGFGHDVRLMWSGFLLRAGLSVDELVAMGEAISHVCNNREVHDVRRSVESTASGLAAKDKKIKGGPSLARQLGANGKAVLARINEWLGRDSDFIRVEGKIVAKNQENVRRAVMLLGHDLSYNEFSDKLLIDNKPMEDREVNSLLTRIEIDFRFQPPENYFERVIKFLAWSNPFHPVKEYLSNLTWDRKPRIDTWLIESASAEDSAYVRAISAIVLIAAVRRIKQPGCKYDEMVVLEGEQGTLKSSAAQALCANPEWFSDDLPLNVKSQQLIEATLGKWIVEASDLAGKRKTEIEQLKAMLSRQRDGPARMAYGHFAVERPRHFIILGTTNSAAYLTDPTGGRRFWPAAIKQFNVSWIIEHRDQLWAEAAHREALGEAIRLPEHLWPLATEQQEARREVDPWEPLIRDVLLNVMPSGDGKRRVIASAIWDCLGIAVERRDRAASLRITDIMQRFGFKRSRVRPSGEEVQIGFVQERGGLEERGTVEEMNGIMREPGSDDVPF